MPIKKLKAFLDENGVEYTTVEHPKTYTALESAEAARITGQEVAKIVMVKVDGKTAMAVLPASEMVDFELLKEAAEAKSVELLAEDEFKDLFPECDLGAMPPFGNLYGLDVFVSKSLGGQEEIAFNAGSHTELLKLAYRDFEKLVQPKVAKIADQ